MKFAIAAAALAVAVSADVNTIQEISENWDAIVSVINGDLPTLKAANPSVYAQATSVIGGTEITQDFNVDLIQEVATGINPALMNAVLSRAGVTGITLDGEAIPTDNAADASSPAESSPEPSSADEPSASESESSSDAESSADESSAADSSDDSSDASDESSGDDESSDSDETDSDTSGAALAVKLSGAALAVAAALF
ncbi:hypothetical protein IWW55_000939 [Coemansia sp. RSA 2706]|nr:hypothetical protein IWW55_000939 [Coemansia sp. RSA 2706]KAJ2326646.1 hypothetical protein IWW51_002165 [Coemansia sp. RSA 2702]